MVAVIDAAPWGTTVAAAATAKIIDAAQTAGDVAEVSAAVESVLLADLPDALEPVLRALDAKAARDADVARLMTAVPALVRAIRYGDVRGTGTGALAAVVAALTARVCAGLPAAVSGLADDAAAGLRGALDGMHAALSLHAQDERGRETRDRWLAALGVLASRPDVHGLLVGRAVRLLTDAGVLPRAESARRFAAHLSIGVPAASKAAWADGFLSGSGLLLVHDRDLLSILDDWLASLADPDFTWRAATAAPDVRRVRGRGTGQHRAGGPAADRRCAGPGQRARSRSTKPGPRARCAPWPPSWRCPVNGTGAGRVAEDERLRRWRLLLGGPAGPGLGARLGQADQAIDGALAALYDAEPGPGRASAGQASLARGRPGWAPRLRRWPAGWATSAPTSRPPWCRSCSGTRSTGSTCGSCCSNRNCSSRSSRMCT